MGLNIVVGVLYAVESDSTELVRADLVAVNELLEQAGAPQWTEPDPAAFDEGESTEFEAWGYSGLHTLRRLAVHLTADGRLPEPLDSRPAGDQRPAPEYGVHGSAQ